MRCLRWRGSPEPMRGETLSTDEQAPQAGVPTWDEIVERHSERVYRLAYRLTGHRPDAEDLTQEDFVRVFRSLHTYQPGTFEGWLHRITTNVFLDRMRRKQRIRFDALSEESAARLPGRGPSPEQAYHDSHFDDDVQRALEPRCFPRSPGDQVPTSIIQHSAGHEFPQSSAFVSSRSSAHLLTHLPAQEHASRVLAAPNSPSNVGA